MLPAGQRDIYWAPRRGPYPNVLSWYVRWNEAAYDVLGGGDERAEARDALALLERWVGGSLPGAVRDWYRFGGDRRLASISSNLITGTGDFASRTVGRFLDHGYLLLETDSQHCCRWVVAVGATDDDPPVYLIDPEDDAALTRGRYAATFSDYAFAAAWDATLWAGEPSTDFDHPIPPGGLDELRRRLVALPETHGWAMNQGCDTVYRFTGAAHISVAVAGGTVLWSAVAAPFAPLRDAFAALLGARPDG